MVKIVEMLKGYNYNELQLTYMLPLKFLSLSEYLQEEMSKWAVMKNLTIRKLQPYHFPLIFIRTYYYIDLTCCSKLQKYVK